MLQHLVGEDPEGLSDAVLAKSGWVKS